MKEHSHCIAEKRVEVPLFNHTRTITFEKEKGKNRPKSNLTLISSIHVVTTY